MGLRIVPFAPSVQRPSAKHVPTCHMSNMHSIHFKTVAHHHEPNKLY